MLHLLSSRAGVLGWYWADFFHASGHIWLVTWDVTQVCVKHWGFSSSDVSKWSVFLQTQHFPPINDQLGPRADRKHPHNPSMSGTAIVPLHSRHRQTNMSAVPNSCNAATHSTRLRERDHDSGSVSGKERPCIAALRVRTTTSHYLAGCGRCRRRMRGMILPFTVNAGSVFSNACVTDTQASAQKQLASINNNTQVLHLIWQGTITQNTSFKAILCIWHHKWPCKICLLNKHNNLKQVEEPVCSSTWQLSKESPIWLQTLSRS